ncbi:MAG: hypothetical protein ACREMU_02955 [Gemmatimonadaceae bacterium]
MYYDLSSNRYATSPIAAAWSGDPAPAASTPWPKAARTAIRTPLFSIRARLGIAVRATGIRAALLHGSRIEWRGAADFDAPAQLSEALRAALADLPSHRVRPRVVVALGPRWAMIRRVLALAPTDATRAATAVIRCNPRAFFHHRSPLLIADTARGIDGAVWCAALEQAVVGHTIAALAERGLRLYAATTSIAAVAHGRTGAWSIVDGSDALVVESVRGRLRAIRHVDPLAARAVGDGFSEACDAARWTGSTFTWRPHRGAPLR